MGKTLYQTKLRYLPIIGWFYFSITTRYVSSTMGANHFDIQWPDKDGNYNFIDNSGALVFGIKFRFWRHKKPKGKYFQSMFND